MKIYKDETGRLIIDGEGNTTVRRNGSLPYIDIAEGLDIAVCGFVYLMQDDNHLKFGDTIHGDLTYIGIANQGSGDFIVVWNKKTQRLLILKDEPPVKIKASFFSRWF